MEKLHDTSKADKLIYGIAFATTLLLALCAFALSYNSLHELAKESGIPAGLSYVFPVVVDGLLLSGSLLILYYSLRGERSWGGVFLVLLGVVASVAGNIVVSPPTLVSRVVHGVSPVVLFLSLEALTTIMRKRINENKIAWAKGHTIPEEQEVEVKATFPSIFSSPDDQKDIKELPSKTEESIAPVIPAKEIKSNPSLIEKSNYTPVVLPDPQMQKLENQTQSESVVSSSSIKEVETTDEGEKAISLPQKIRNLITENPDITVDEIVTLIPHKDKKYLRRVARKELGLISS